MFFNKTNQYRIFLDGRLFSTISRKGRKSKVCKELAKSIRLTFPNASIVANIGMWGEVVVNVVSGEGNKSFYNWEWEFPQN